MKIFRSVLLIFCCLSSSIVFAQTPQDSTITIESKSSGKLSGKIISESKDSIKFETEQFGIITIAKSEVIYENQVFVVTSDGNEFIGTIVKDDGQKIVLKTANLGEITISKTDIRSQRNIESKQFRKGEFWGPNPQSTRYFWSPNAYGLKKGEGYYQNIWVLWNQFAYGLSDNFSIGGGVIPLFLFDGGPTPVFATAKFSVPLSNDKINLGGGAILGTIIGEEDGGLGIVYGISTFGSRDNNVTLGMGYGFADGEWTNSPMITVSGMFRISKRGYIITENYFINDDSELSVMLTIGGRSILKKAALDYGLVIPVGVDANVAIPWLGVTVPFWKK